MSQHAHLPQPSPKWTMKQYHDVGLFGGKAFGSLTTPFLHWWTTIGSHAFGVSTVLGFFFTTLLIADYDGPAKGEAFFYAVAAAFFASRVAGFLYRDPEVHSRYDGYPVICMIRGRLTGNPGGEVETKLVGEPAVILLAAWALSGWSQGLAIALALAAAGQVFRTASYMLMEAAVHRQARDARTTFQVLTRTGRPLATAGSGRGPGLAPAPGRRLAKLVLGLGAAWIAYVVLTGQAGYQLRGLPIPAAVAGLLPSDNRAPQVRPIGVQEDRAARDRLRRQQWRRWNNGFTY